jgi:hypothetical protein
VAAPAISCYWLDRPEAFSQPLPRGAAQMRTEQEVGAWPCPADPHAATAHQDTRDVAMSPGAAGPFTLWCQTLLCKSQPLVWP